MATDETPNERIHKARGLERDFVILRNKDVQRKDLSYEAIGMLVYLMSRPEDWSVYVNELKREGAGRDKVRGILNELQAKGYIYIKQTQNKDGTFGLNEYHAYAMPEYNPHFQPLTENPSTDKPSTDNLHLQNKDSNKVKKQTNHAPSATGDIDYASEILNSLDYTDWVSCYSLCITLPHCPTDLFDAMSFSRHPAQIAMEQLHADGKVEWITDGDGRAWRRVPEGEKPHIYGVHSHDNFQNVKRAVQQHWGVGGNGLAEQIAKLICGTNKNKGWKEYGAEFATAPMTVDEIQAFCSHWKKEHPTLSLPEKPQTIENAVAKFRKVEPTTDAQQALGDWDSYGN